MQGYTVSSRYGSDDYDELLALSCDACSEQVRQNKLSTSGISYGAYLLVVVLKYLYLVSSLYVVSESHMRSFVIPRQPAVMQRSCSMRSIGEETARFKKRKVPSSSLFTHS